MPALPRRHQSDRARRRSLNPAGVHYELPEGAYAGIVAWQSREHLLTWVVPVAIVATPHARGSTLEVALGHGAAVRLL